MPLKEVIKWIVLAFGLLLFVSGCGPDAAGLEATVVAQAAVDIGATVAALPTMTAQPTLTAEPTYTSEPTETAEPTLTTLPTYTPAATYTPEPTYTPEATYTPIPTETPLPAPTAPPQPTAPPTAQFTAAGVALTKSYMDWFPGAYGGCVWISNQQCLKWDLSIDCVAFVNNRNVLAARQNLAPQNAEEPIRTAAAIYTATILEFLAVISPHVTYCQEQMALDRTEVASQEVENRQAIVAREVELLNQMQQALTIMEQVETGNGQ